MTNRQLLKKKKHDIKHQPKKEKKPVEEEDPDKIPVSVFRGLIENEKTNYQFERICQRELINKGKKGLHGTQVILTLFVMFTGFITVYDVPVDMDFMLEDQSRVESAMSYRLEDVSSF